MAISPVSIRLSAERPAHHAINLGKISAGRDAIINPPQLLMRNYDHEFEWLLPSSRPLTSDMDRPNLAVSGCTTNGGRRAVPNGRRSLPATFSVANSNSFQTSCQFPTYGSETLRAIPGIPILDFRGTSKYDGPTLLAMDSLTLFLPSHGKEGNTAPI